LREGREWCLDERLRQRRLRLARLLEHVPGGIAKLTPQFPSTELESLLGEIWARGGEGIIVKNLDGRYEQGKRSRSWIKVKAVQTADGVILGFTEGEGKYSDTIGAIIVGQYRRDGVLHKVCKMSGMTDRLRYQLGNDRDGYLGSVIEFAYQNRTNDSYRHPRFKRFRPDKGPEECIWEDT
ncbi:MAG TPA: hypothetical protein VFK94_01790, partial [Patescibacteria group bacterium]|nr:hypothetical protein [Patescibacteria group bacterium]